MGYHKVVFGFTISCIFCCFEGLIELFITGFININNEAYSGVFK